MIGVVADDAVMQTRTIRKRNTNDVKQGIACELEKMLSASTEMIGTLSQQIDTVVCKLKELVAEKDSFYARQKAHKLEQYKKRLEIMRIELETTVKKVAADLSALEKNFE